MAFPTQNITNPVSVPHFLLYIGYSPSSWLCKPLFLAWSVQLIYSFLLHPSPAPLFETSQVFLIHFSEVSKFQHHAKLCSKFCVHGSVHRNTTNRSNKMQQYAHLATLEEGCWSDTLTCTRGCSYSFMYSWLLVRWTPETCRVILQ